MEDRHATELVSRAETLLATVEQVEDPAAREPALALVQALLQLYGEALARLLAILTGAAADLRTRLVDDELVSHLLLLHGLHPLDVGDRITRALAALRPRRGGAVAELVEVDGTAARLRVDGGGGCGSSRASAVEAVREAVLAAAPEIAEVQLEQPAPAPVLVPLESLRGPA
jgi:hypothetical protein